MVHIHWASHARNQRSHARLHIFSGNKLYGLHKYTAFFYHIVIVYVRNYHNMVKKYCFEALLQKKNWSLAWDHWFCARDAQCMCTITLTLRVTSLLSKHDLTLFCLVSRVNNFIAVSTTRLKLLTTWDDWYGIWATPYFQIQCPS